MSEHDDLTLRLADLQAKVEAMPAIEITAPQPVAVLLTPDELKELDAAFAPSQDQQAAAGLLALWAAGPMLGDLVAEHLRQEKKLKEDELVEQPRLPE